MQIREPGEMYLETIYVLRKRMRLPIKKSLSDRGTLRKEVCLSYIRLTTSYIAPQ